MKYAFRNTAIRALLVIAALALSRTWLGRRPALVN